MRAKYAADIRAGILSAQKDIAFAIAYTNLHPGLNFMPFIPDYENRSPLFHKARLHTIETHLRNAVKRIKKSLGEEEQ